jgi:RNase adapter protein RapZ
MTSVPDAAPVDPAELQLVLVTGMSGAGRSTAARALEDLGWFVIDNLPPSLIDETVALVGRSPDVRLLAVVVDARGGSFFDRLERATTQLRADGVDLRVLFLEASDEALVRRFESSRRPHPLQGSGRLIDGLARERRLLSDLRADADLVIDTSGLNVHDLRRKVDAAFHDGEPVRLRATVMSFGFKYGLPVDADVVADVRFLPNPYWVPQLRDHTGRDAAVSEYVLAQPGAQEYLQRYTEIIDLVSEGYLREGKRYVTVALGCTGGKHRSVAMAEDLGRRLRESGTPTLVLHRDLGRE